MLRVHWALRYTPSAWGGPVRSGACGQSLLGGKEIVYVESDLDEELLQQIAEMTGGQYFRAIDTPICSASTIISMP